MTRVDITLGLLAILGSIMIAALVGFGEEERMSKASVGYDMRSVETGAQLFNQYCASCHGLNASGLNCPPLNELSGLHGGDLGPGVAWRLEEQHWDRADPYGYVSSAISAGRMASTRPDRYRGTSPDAMQMPPWSQNYGGPLRPDQIMDLTNYVINFREYFPAADEEDARDKACQMVIDNIQKPGAPVPSVAGYTSTCYDTLCTLTIQASDPDFVMPEEPTEPNPADEKYTENPDQLELDQQQYVRDVAARQAFWARCESLGGVIPPPTVAAPASSSAADSTTPPADGTSGPASEAAGTPGAAGTGTPAADGTAAATGSPGSATASPAAQATPTGTGG
jgi:hypothetical protein